MRALGAAFAVTLLAAGCGGADGDSGDNAAGQIVVSEEALESAIAERDGTSDAEIARVEGAESTDDSGGTDAPDPAAGAETEAEPEEDEIEVAEAEEDELDNLMNSLSTFNACLGEAGFELDGFPGDGSGREASDFDGAYLQALGACAAESGIQEAGSEFAASQANLTPEEIEATNFGLPIFKECMEDLGWVIGDLTPDERGALGFGESGNELQPPGGGGFEDFNTDDVSACRLEAEQYVADNFDAEATS